MKAANLTATGQGQSMSAGVNVSFLSQENIEENETQGKVLRA
jgi:hypothetical protein